MAGVHGSANPRSGMTSSSDYVTMMQSEPGIDDLMSNVAEAAEQLLDMVCVCVCVCVCVHVHLYARFSLSLYVRVYVCFTLSVYARVC